MNLDDTSSIANFLGSFLSEIESNDCVLYEEVNLNAYFPSMPQASFDTKPNSRRSGKTIIDLKEISKDSINAIRGKNAQLTESTKLREKDTLLAKQKQLEQEIEIKNNTIKELENLKRDLERQVTDVRNRSRIGSRPVISYSETRASPRITEDVSDDAYYWKKQYEQMHLKYEKLRSDLDKKGAITRVSGNQLRLIPNPNSLSSEMKK